MLWGVCPKAFSFTLSLLEGFVLKLNIIACSSEDWVVSKIIDLEKVAVIESTYNPNDATELEMITFLLSGGIESAFDAGAFTSVVFVLSVDGKIVESRDWRHIQKLILST